MSDMFKKIKNKMKIVLVKTKLGKKENNEICNAKMLNMWKKMKTYVLNNCPEFSYYLESWSAYLIKRSVLINEKFLTVLM